MEGSPTAHKAGGHAFVLTLAGLDLDYRLCMAAAAGVALALCGGGHVELLVAALAFLRTAWSCSKGTGAPSTKATWKKGAEVPPPQRSPPLPRIRAPAAAEGSAVSLRGLPHQKPKEGDSMRAPGAAVAAVQDGGPKPFRGHPASHKYVALIMEHARAKQCAQALGLLTEMRQLSIAPNVACYTALISACDKGKQPERALELFDMMQSQGCVPTVVTYNALISACSNGQMPEMAMEKCAEMQERGLTPNVVTYTSLIRACGQSHHPQRAWDIFDAMKEAGETPNVITFSSLIQAAEKCQDPEKGLRIFAEMEEAGIAPSLFAYNNLKSCWRSQPLYRALQAIRTMENEGKPPSNAARWAVRSACDQGKLEREPQPSTTAAHNAPAPDCLTELSEMPLEGPKPDGVSYAAVIGSCEKSRQPEKALRLFQKMLDEGVLPDIMVFNCALRCCEQLGDAGKATEVFEKMSEKQVNPDVDTYATLISVGGNGCTIAMDYFKEMQGRGLTPTCHAYNTAISACSHLKRRNGKNGVCIGLALDLFRSMKEANVVPDAGTYSALIAACERRLWPLRAEELFREMEASGLEPDVIAYNGLISCWAASKKAERAVQLLEEMQSKGVAPNAITYSTLAWACEKAGDEAKVREFKAKEAECIRFRDRKEDAYIRYSPTLAASRYRATARAANA